MNLKEKLKNDLKSSMKSGDNVARSVLRLLNSDIKNAEIEKQKELTDENLIKIVRSNIKKRKDSIELYKKGNRKDLVESEEAELKVLEKYVPPQMSVEDMRIMVQKCIKDSGATSVSDFGKVMRLVMKAAEGRADGNTVGNVVKEELGKL